MSTASVPSSRRGVGRGTRRGPGFFARHKRAIAIGVLIASIIGFVYLVLPEVSGLRGTLHRLKDAEPAWIGLAVLVEVLSLTGYALLFRTVFSRQGTRVGWRE